jgi:hypothetical protein
MRRIPALPSWVPSDRALVSLFVLILVFVTSIGGGGGSGRSGSIAAPAVSTIAQTTVPVSPTTDAAVVPTSPQAPTATASQPTPSQPTATLMPGINVDQPTAEVSADGSILPKFRIISFYGHPTSTDMGVLGEFPDDLTGLEAKLREEAGNFEAADPSRPVKIAFEVIASVGQNWPAENDTYLMHTGEKIIDKYVAYAEKHDILVILDVQIGHSTVAAEIDSVRKWLEKPFVHLAIDPEFAMPDGEIPGQAIGTVDASDISVAQDELGQLVDQLGLPPKLLIVHRFTEGMITNDTNLESVPGVQLVIDFDGFGDPAAKQELYTLFTGDKKVEFAGIKLFYKQDSPIMSAAQVVALDPAPDLVIFQ